MTNSINDVKEDTSVVENLDVSPSNDVEDTIAEGDCDLKQENDNEENHESVNNDAEASETTEAKEELVVLESNDTVPSEQQQMDVSTPEVPALSTEVPTEREVMNVYGEESK